METLSKVWSLIVTGEPTVWAAIIAGIIGVVGALIGGWIGGRVSGSRAVNAALEGAKKAHLDTIDREDRVALRLAIAFVQAVRAEAECLLATVSKNMFPGIAAIDIGKPLSAKFLISDGYFTVYRANAHLLGSIEDSATRKSIVAAYIAAQSFIDTIRMNNRLVEKCEEAEKVVILSGATGGSTGAAMAARSELETFSHGVVTSKQELELRVQEFLDATNAWLRAHNVEPDPRPGSVLPAA